MKRASPSLFRPLRITAALSLYALYIPATHAVTFNIGEIEGQFDSSLSIGSSWSTQNPKAKLLHSRSVDDGKLNFREGDSISRVFKGIHDLELKYADSGVFVRGKYWYDFVLKDEDLRYKNISDSGREEAAKSAGAEFLDAFVYHNYEIHELPGVVKLGKQVVNWGESTFIQGGINAINPVDVSSFRRPGSEIKEGLVPVNMFYLSQSLSESFSTEMFYQFGWDKTVIDNCGTFFSGNDVVADGCGGLPVGPVIYQNPLAQQALSPFGIKLTSEGIEIPRAHDNDPRDSGQWGMALRWFAPQWDSEFGAYFMNYHSRMPYISAVTSPHAVDMGFAPELCGNLGVPAAACSAVLGSAAGQSLAQAYRLGTSKYYVDYPEDVRLYGLSFSTSLPTGTTLAGEVSYRPNMPLQINPYDLITAGTGITALSPLLSSGAIDLQNSTAIAGYRRKEVTQAQVTATHFFDQVMGADRLTLIGEVGYVHVGGLEGRGGLRYGRSTAYGGGAIYPDNSVCTSTSATPEYCSNDGFTTSDAWGYRARAIWEYSNVIQGLELKPNLAWSHDVDGYGPEPGFNEGSKAASVGLDATYLNTYNASLSYTNFFGGDYNVNVDRDFVALSVGVSF
ncbi:DUF1302 domain-containing protein [Pseudomonas nitroreducens]|uniref:DUF1302 domain-containing protein n=1 Tax=Pseudomonas nitroreducens TaxID=46680 RepID=UPI00265AC8A0|nr:DUF1302 domain-containing protein [Pseudomonas nitroreducens]MCP1647935.1 hypothetical protein [Pseudomonas nitroreducens]MCP1686511.1 hypothetical protein [Pseudomonas nitroreducens]